MFSTSVFKQKESTLKENSSIPPLIPVCGRVRYNREDTDAKAAEDSTGARKCFLH